MKKIIQYQTAEGQLIGSSSYADYTTRTRYAKKAISLGYSSLQELDRRSGQVTELSHYVENRRIL